MIEATHQAAMAKHLPDLNKLKHDMADAQAKGAIGDFVKQLLQQFGPMIAPLLLTILSAWLHIPIPPIPTP